MYITRLRGRLQSGESGTISSGEFFVADVQSGCNAALCTISAASGVKVLARLARRNSLLAYTGVDVRTIQFKPGYDEDEPAPLGAWCLSEDREWWNFSPAEARSTRAEVLSGVFLFLFSNPRFHCFELHVEEHYGFHEQEVRTRDCYL
ncbi:hypothetical protein B0H16DRAFT_1453646 [Mycena metata]|uniref:Uncharacterized protein n=1 Tax=Mycena metata TaxID=1033252 RepID=A0AAD7JLD8_9AGAR|nr:hypothetical protein B0H16DRAFT_1453646 [Mycena metata]